VNANQLFNWRKQYPDGRLGVNGRECALLPVTVNEASDGGGAKPAASPPAASAPGKIRIQLPRGEVHVEGSVDPDTLRVVVQSTHRQGPAQKLASRRGARPFRVTCHA
jgi:transposase